MRPGEGAAQRLEGTETELEDIEIRLLLEGIRLYYGYDFREYALTHLRRGLSAAMAAERVATISAFQDRVLHDAALMQQFLGTVGVNVTTMFRDSETIRCLRRGCASAQDLPILPAVGRRLRHRRGGLRAGRRA